MENSHNLEETKMMENNENINEINKQNVLFSDVSKQQADFLPNQTLYINNLNEKIKNDGINILIMRNINI